MFASHLTPKQHVAVAKLVGKKCKVSCVLDGVKVEALWDTGAQVSIVSKAWLQEHLPTAELKPVKELLGEDLNLKAANGGPIPYEGWIEVQFQLASRNQSSTPLAVPLLVARDELEYPIIGYNVIEEVVTDKEQLGEENISSLVEVMTATFTDIKEDMVTALIDLVQKSSTENLCMLRSSKKDVTVPPGQTVRIPCRVDCGPLERKTPVLFEPVQDSIWPVGLEVSERLLTLPAGLPHRVNIEVHNAAKHGVTLGRHTPLGCLQLVQSVTPLEVTRKDQPHTRDNTSKTETEEKWSLNKECSNSQPNSEDEQDAGKVPHLVKTPAVELGDLTEEQRQLATTMLQEEAESFAQDDGDMGCIKELQLDLELTDTTPVQKTYTSVPRPLYAEVKHYIEDLLNRGWITKSRSSYSSPVVCVRKKDGGLRLCIDYRELNRKTVPDRHPIP